MEAFKNVGSVLLGIAIIAVSLFLIALLINGMAWVSGHVLEYLITFNNIVTVVCIVLLLLGAPFRETRIVPAYGLYVASFVFGVCVWMYGFMVTYQIWGGVGVFIGLMLGVVGIVPLGIIAASLHSEWVIVAELIYGLVLTYGARVIALWLWAKLEADSNRPEHVQGPSGAGPHFSSPGMGLLNHLFPEGSQLSLHAKAKREVLQVWQTFLEHDPDVSEAVERLSALSPRNVEEFRTLLLQHRDRTRVKEFEDEAIRRIQGSAFVDDAPLLQAYINLNREDGRLGEELVRVVGVIGKPEDLERTVAQVRQKFLAKEAEARARQAAAATEAERERQERDAAATREAEEKARQEERRKKEEAFAAAKRADTVSAVDAFLATYPESHLAGEARALRATLLARDDAYKGAVASDPAALKAFLKDYPKGAQADEVRRRLLRRRNVVAVVATIVLLIFGIAGWRIFAPQSPQPNNSSVPSQNTPKPQQSSTGAAAAGLFEEAAAAYGRGDYGTALRLFRPLADQGNAQAQYSLGFMYAHGQAAAANYTEAMKWFLLAADQGHVGAQYSLGFMYHAGRGVPQNYAEAMKWFSKAADQGNADAQFGLGGEYYFGLGVPQNYTAAFKWFLLAADQGQVGAQYSLGVMYANGRGVPQNYAEAMKWFSKAAAQGNADAYPSSSKLVKLWWVYYRKFSC